MNLDTFRTDRLLTGITDATRDLCRAMEQLESANARNREEVTAGHRLTGLYNLGSLVAEINACEGRRYAFTEAALLSGVPQERVTEAQDAGLSDWTA